MWLYVSGGPGHASVASFSGAMLVAGGSGITYALSTLQELVQKGMDGGSRVRAIDLAWSMTDPGTPLSLIQLRLLH